MNDEPELRVLVRHSFFVRAWYDETMKYEMGMIGAGNMAEAIVRGVLRAGIFAAGQIVVSDVSPQRRGLFEKQLTVRAVEDNSAVARESKVVVLSIKPQKMAEALSGIGQVLRDQSLVISIMAGISTAKIEAQLGAAKSWRIVRCMPNTPMLVGEGMAVISAGGNAAAEDLAMARRIFQSSATVLELPESMLDAVTAISGSGPAYFFFLVEQMIKGGVEMGFTPEQAHLLATRTASGAAKMMISSKDSPEELRRKVTSPGGTTQAAIETMQSRYVPDAIVAALKHAAQRSRELGQ